LLQNEVAGIVKNAGARMLAGGVEKALEGSAVVQVLAWVQFKAQIHAGGRGKGGGVKVVKGVAAARDAAGKIFGRPLVTHQTGPEGRIVKRLLIEQGVSIARELYASVLVDRARSRVAVMVSAAGGMDIEEVAHKTPDKIATFQVEPAAGYSGYIGNQIATALELRGDEIKQCGALVKSLYDAFVAKLNPTGSALVYSTYLGGYNEDQGIAIAVDSTGSAYVTGFTDSADFPTVNAFQQPKLIGDSDAFVTKINPAGTAFVYSTCLGGTSLDQGNGIAVDALGQAWITGVTESTNFPTTNAIQLWPGGGQDAFVTVIASNGLYEVLSTYLGGAGDDAGFRIAFDANKTHAYVVGTDGSSWSFDGSLPITPGNLSPGGVFTSTDAGNHWSQSSTYLLHPRVLSLAVDPLSPSRVYAGTGHGVARSTNSGATWNTTVQAQPTDFGFAPAIAIGQIFALAISPLRPSTLYAGTSQGVYQSTNAGLGWTLASTGRSSSALG